MGIGKRIDDNEEKFPNKSKYIELGSEMKKKENNIHELRAAVAIDGNKIRGQSFCLWVDGLNYVFVFF